MRQCNRQAPPAGVSRPPAVGETEHAFQAPAGACATERAPWTPPILETYLVSFHDRTTREI